MVRYHYVDVLLLKKDGHFYAGCTQNIIKRLEQHNSGQVQATKRPAPLFRVFFTIGGPMKLPTLLLPLFSLRLDALKRSCHLWLQLLRAEAFQQKVPI